MCFNRQVYYSLLWISSDAQWMRIWVVAEFFWLEFGTDETLWATQGDHTPWAHRWFIDALEDSSSGSPYVNHAQWPSWRIFFMLQPSTNERISETANWVETIRTRRAARRVPTRAGARRVQHARAWYMCHWNLFSTIMVLRYRYPYLISWISGSFIESLFLQFWISTTMN